MNDIKYIYYEIVYLTGDNFIPPYNKQMCNENILLLKPGTSSTGNWVHCNITKRSFKDREDTKKTKLYSNVVQYWIDLEKYDMEKFQSETLDIEECLLRLQKRLDENR